MQKQPASHTTAGKLAAAKNAKSHGIFPWPESAIKRPKKKAKADRAQIIADEYFAARSPVDWKRSDIIALAELSALTVDLDEMTAELRDCNYLLEKQGSQGQVNLEKHPLVAVMATISTRAVNIARMLNLHARPDASRQIDTRRRNVEVAASDRSVQPKASAKKPKGDLNDWSTLVQ